MKREILEYIEENDVKFIKLAFSDLFGEQKNMSIIADEAERAIDEGISFDASSVKGFADIEKSDLFLMPDLETGDILPWRPSMGRVLRFYSSVETVDGEICSSDMRSMLKDTVEKYNKIGLCPQIGTECEFYLFKTDESGAPTYMPIDEATCFDIAPLDKGENIRRDICLTLEELGMHPENSHHECGYGQNEVDFRYAGACKAADNFMTFKSTVKSVAARNGFFASFMPKPMKDRSGSGLHVNISLKRGENNIFQSDDSDEREIVENFIAGIMKRISEITLFLNSNINSYARLGTHQAPKYVSWSHQNRSQLIRIPATKGKLSRMELRSPDSCINPYLAFMLILEAGLEGIENKTELPASVDVNLFEASAEITKELEVLPTSLESAIKTAKASEFVKKILPENVFDKFIKEKELSIRKYSQTADVKDHMYKRYFKKL
ncbi:MAG: glutamine synthetase family protein [Bacillota bacterium]